MAGRPRLAIGTYGTIQATEVTKGRFRAMTRFRDWDGRTRQVAATGASRNAAITALKQHLQERMRHAGTQATLTPDSKFIDLADAWLGDLRLDVDRAESTKETYERQLRSSVLPFFADFAVREITVGRIERYLKQQRQRSFSMAKHSKTTLSMVLAFGVRRAARAPRTEPSQGNLPAEEAEAGAEGAHSRGAVRHPDRGSRLRYRTQLVWTKAGRSGSRPHRGDARHRDPDR
ncbi:tyrosine-type recombinase/integrase [Agromyces bauzanensis]